MAKKRKIQDPEFLYSLLKHYVDYQLKMSYRRIEYVGKENIPEDGSIIFAPNHANALMDALVVLALREEPTVFVSRADIFKNPKIAKLLAFIKMMPIKRIRDGINEVRKNDETFQKAVDVLKDGVAFCILPEGTHRGMHSLLPLTKGIFRIAIKAQKNISDKVPIYIVPLGIEYGNFYRFRSTVLVQIGRPINVKNFLEEHSEDTIPEIMNMMKSELSNRMKENILYIPDDEDYYPIYQLTSIMLNYQIESLKEEKYDDVSFAEIIPVKDINRSILVTRREANKLTVAQILKMKEENPELARKILDLCQEIYDIRVKAKISSNSIIVKHPFWSRTLNINIAILGSPYILAMHILDAPINIVSRLLFKRFSDKTFYNSLQFFVTLFLKPILLTIYAIILFVLFRWEWALLALILIIPMNIVTEDSLHLLRIIRSDIKLLNRIKLRKKISAVRKLFIKSI